MGGEAPLNERDARPGQDGSARATVLVPFCFWLARPGGQGPEARPPRADELRGAIRSHLTAAGHPGAVPLRWAITAVDPVQGLQLEGVGLQDPRSPGER